MASRRDRHGAQLRKVAPPRGRRQCIAALQGLLARRLGMRHNDARRMKGSVFHACRTLRTMRFVILTLAIIALLAGTLRAERPNLVVILADDLGFSDLGCYGGEIQTPNLDRLAAGGVRFSQFYNCALCGPSRAALMTGLQPHQVGIFQWTGLLNQRCVTMFELLKQAGYATCAVGRLDMVTADDWHDPAMVQRYVDRFLGSTGHTGPGNYFKDVRNTQFYRDGRPYTLPPEGAYKTDLITDFATEFIGQAATKQQPFFLYVAQYAPHWPCTLSPQIWPSTASCTGSWVGTKRGRAATSDWWSWA